MLTARRLTGLSAHLSHDQNNRPSVLHGHAALHVYGVFFDSRANINMISACSPATPALKSAQKTDLSLSSLSCRPALSARFSRQRHHAAAGARYCRWRPRFPAGPRCRRRAYGRICRAAESRQRCLLDQASSDFAARPLPHDAIAAPCHVSVCSHRHYMSSAPNAFIMQA